MSHFDKIIPSILEHEGGYSCIAADPGGETNYGICKRNYPDLDIRHLTEDEVIEIYRRDYWKAYMDEMPINVAAKHFDMAVNMGHSRAVKLLQEAVGCDADGLVGLVTMAAIKTREPAAIVNALVSLQRDFYTALATRKPSQKIFLKGWLNRANWTPDL